MPILRQPVDPEKANLARQLRRRMTVAERLLWEQLRTNRLSGLHFLRQQVMAGFIVEANLPGMLERILHVAKQLELPQVENIKNKEIL